MILKRNEPDAAKRARATLSAIYAWLIGNSRAEPNPVVGTIETAQRRSAAGLLSPDEIKAALKACRDDDFGRIVRSRTRTGQRREEVAGMKRAELDLASGIWRLPGQRTKNSLLLDVPLSRASTCSQRSSPVLAGRSCSVGAPPGSRDS
ncbi:MAG: hypothetical protein PGN33_22700 [Methylobacterium radiotolerans]